MDMKNLCEGLRMFTSAFPRRRGFTGESFTYRGIVRNAFSLCCDSGEILIGSPSADAIHAWLDAANSPRFFIPLGAETDIAASAELRKRFPDCTILADAKTVYKIGPLENVTMLRGSCHYTLGGRELAFVALADSALYVIDSQTHALFTADAFGAYCAEESADYLKTAEDYYRDAFSSRQASARKAAQLVKDHEIRILCPANGPVKEDFFELFSIYENHSRKEKELPVAALLYWPENFTGQMAEQIAQGIQESGKVDVHLVDLSLVSREDALREAIMADALLFGSPFREGNTVKAVTDIVTSLKKEQCEGKIASCFLSSESTDRSVNALRLMLGALNCDLSVTDLVLNGRPDSAMLEYAAEYGYALGCRLLKIPNKRKPAMVKCLVCGEIFDSSLGICPVCGAGLEQCAPVDAESSVFHQNTNRKYLILGAGSAAIAAASAIRLRDETGEILMLSNEKELPINRPLLSKDTPVGPNELSLELHDQAWYDEQKIRIELNTTVTKIDPARRCVVASGREYAYDRLIYALGSECFVPPFKGREKDGVITLRHRSDLEDMWKRMQSAKNAVIIGGGAIGLEAGSKMLRCGIHVTILEAAPQIMARQIDRESADQLIASVFSLGAECYEGVNIQEIIGDEKCAGVRLADGREFPADLVLVSCGVKPTVQLAAEAGMDVDRAVKVNVRMETNIPDVYACGDCAIFEGVNLQLWSEAGAQGRIAGANAAGEKMLYSNPMPSMGQSFFNTSFFFAGDPGKKPGVSYQKVVITDEVEGKRQSYWFNGHALCGAVLLRCPEKTADIAKAVAEQARYEELF